MVESWISWKVFLWCLRWGSGGEGRNSVRKPRYFSRPFSERGKIFEDVKYLRAKKKGFPFKVERSIFWTVSALSLLPKRAEIEREREREREREEEEEEDSILRLNIWCSLLLRGMREKVGSVHTRILKTLILSCDVPQSAETNCLEMSAEWIKLKGEIRRFPLLSQLERQTQFLIRSHV